MPVVTLGTFTTQQLNETADDFAAEFNYDVNKIGAETKNEFAIRMIIRFCNDLRKRRRRTVTEISDLNIT